MTIGILGIAIALFAYFKPRKRLKFAYQTTSTRYFAQEDYALPSEVVMTFKGDNVERLSKSTTIFWNAGTDVLRGEDIVQSDPIRIGLEPSARILSHTVCGSTKDTNQVQVYSVEDAPHMLVLSYDYLDPKDGFVLEIMHDSKHRKPWVTGNAIGLSDGPKRLGVVSLAETFSPRIMHRAFRLSTYLFSAAGGLALLLGIAIFLILDSPNVFPSWLDFLVVWITEDFKRSNASAMVAIGAAYSLPPIAMIWFARRRYPKALTKYVRNETDN